MLTHWDDCQSQPRGVQGTCEGVTPCLPSHSLKELPHEQTYPGWAPASGCLGCALFRQILGKR